MPDFRTTAEAVEKIIKVKTGDDLTPFIETANSMVTDLCTDSGYSDEKLELIERWLSAHYYATYKPRTIQESVEGVAEQFEGRTQVGLGNSRYGQQAMVLDYKGNLKIADARRGRIKATIMQLGPRRDRDRRRFHGFDC